MRLQARFLQQGLPQPVQLAFLIGSLKPGSAADLPVKAGAEGMSWGDECVLMLKGSRGIFEHSVN